MKAIPRVTIGMPVYNGAATVAASIESLLAQEFGDFELVVSDNASTDETPAIVARLAAADPRVRYVRQPVNLGAGGNYTFVARAARGEFLKWAAAGDWCAPRFLSRCLTALDGDAGAVLAAPRTMLFADDRSRAEPYPEDVEILDESPARRFARLEERMRLNNAMNGLIRTAALRKTRLIASYPRADLVMMGHLAMLGKFLLVPEPLFFRRMEPSSATALQDREAVRRFHYPVRGREELFPAWRRHTGMFRAALSAPMSPGDRLNVLGWLTRSLYWDRRALAGDLGEAWRYATGRAT